MGETKKRSVFGPVRQRVYGLVKIAEGLATLVLGKYAPNWTYEYALRGARRAAGLPAKAKRVDL